MLYEISFANASGETLLKTRLFATDISSFKVDSGYQVISMDLENIPVIIFNRTTQMEIAILARD